MLNAVVFYGGERSRELSVSRAALAFPAIAPGE
jgi:hypothetical protein